MAYAQGAPPAAPSEQSVKTVPATSGPITVQWNMRKVNGSASLTINPDGSYLFSGQVQDRKPNRDYDISIALKSKVGILLFHYVGNDANGVQWSEQGQSDVLKEDFAAFAAGHRVAWSYDFPLSSEGRERLYKERKAKREALRREEKEARERHDEKVAAKKREELRQEEQREAQEEIDAARSHGGGGGGGVVSDIVSAASTVGTVVNAVGGVVSDIASFF